MFQAVSSAALIKQEIFHFQSLDKSYDFAVFVNKPLNYLLNCLICYIFECGPSISLKGRPDFNLSFTLALKKQHWGIATRNSALGIISLMIHAFFIIHD